MYRCPFILFYIIVGVSVQVDCLKNHTIKGSVDDDRCLLNRDCVLPNSYCSKSQECMCIIGYILHETKDKGKECLKVPLFPGDVCKEDIQCQAGFGLHSECRPGDQLSGQCLCKTDSHFRNGICFKTSRIGEPCRVEDECLVETVNLIAYCFDGKCICPPHRHPNQNGTDCLPSAKLDEQCSSDNDCIVENSKCYDVCRCSVRFVISIKGNRCLPAAEKLGWLCEEDRQCTEYLQHSMCDPKSRRCVCAVYAHENKESCWISRRLTESCDHSSECLIESKNHTRVECQHKTCQCTPGHVLKGDNDCVRGRSCRNLINPLLFLLVIYLIDMVVGNNFQCPYHFYCK